MGRRGPKKQEGKREGNGRLSRKPAEVIDRLKGKLEREERETLRTGVEARHRLFGIAPELVRDQKAGSFVGRLCMHKEISRAQYEAAMQYLTDWQDVAGVIGMPHSPSAVDLNRIHGSGNAVENVERSVRLRKRWMGARQAVQEWQNELRGAGMLFAALDYLVLRDEEHYHMLGSLREALNALARHYRIVENEEAA